MSARRYRLHLTLLWAAVLSWPAMLWAAQTPVTFTLDNGLRVVVQPDHRAPMVMTQMWYLAGSADEPAGLTGISHFLEHMMFKGTQKVPVGEFSRLIAHFGGDDNAYTTDNYTVYFQEHVASRLPLALELEADRMQNLVLRADELERERQVVMEERRWRTDDRPQSKAYERFQLQLFPSSTQRTPTVGWMGDLERISIDDMRAWYQRWYVPNNAVLVIVGHVELKQVEQWVRQYFSAIPARPLSPRTPPREFNDYGERLVKLNLKAPTASLFMGFNWPSLTSAEGAGDAIGLSLLSAILDGGMSARLERNLVRTGKVMAVSSGYDPLAFGDTALFINAVPAAGQPLEALSSLILAELQRVADEPPTKAELARVQANLLAQRYFAQDSLSEQARWLGVLTALSLPLDWLTTYEQRLQAISPEQISDLARRYLQRERMAVVLLPAQTEAP